METSGKTVKRLEQTLNPINLNIFISAFYVFLDYFNVFFFIFAVVKLCCRSAVFLHLLHYFIISIQFIQFVFEFGELAFYSFYYKFTFIYPIWECSLCSLARSLTNKINLLKYILELATVIKIIFKCWKMELEEPGGQDFIVFIVWKSGFSLCHFRFLKLMKNFYWKSSISSQCVLPGPPFQFKNF